MILNPKTSKQYTDAIHSALRADPETLVIGNSSESDEAATVAVETGMPVQYENCPVTERWLDAMRVRASSPARYAYYRDLILNKPGSTLPRLNSRVKLAPQNPKIIAINRPGDTRIG